MFCISALVKRYQAMFFSPLTVADVCHCNFAIIWLNSFYSVLKSQMKAMCFMYFHWLPSLKDHLLWSCWYFKKLFFCLCVEGCWFKYSSFFVSFNFLKHITCITLHNQANSDSTLLFSLCWKVILGWGFAYLCSLGTGSK